MAKKPGKWPPKEQDVLPLMSDAERAQFQALDPEVRHFLLNATEKEREIFLALPPLEMFRFPRLSPQQRQEYLRLTPKEKALLANMSDDAWRDYVSMPAAKRQEFLAGTKEGKQHLERAKQAQARAGEVARAVEEAFSRFIPSGVQKAQVLSAAHNALSAGATVDEARAAAVRALVADPEVEKLIVDEVSAKVPSAAALRWKSLSNQLLPAAAAVAESADALVEALTREAAALEGASKDAPKGQDLAQSVGKALRGRGISG